MPVNRTSVIAAFPLCFAMTTFAAESTYNTEELANMACESFLELDDQLYPQIIYWIDGYHSHESDTATFTEAWLVEPPVARIVTECKQAPDTPVHEIIDDINDDFSES